MILRRVRIEGWRAFSSGVETADLDERINVIHAPNGTGKSTWLEGLRRGLLDSHRTRGQDVEQLRPWGTRLAPKVTIEFADRGVEYRLSKRFLDEAAADLLRNNGATWEPILAGEEATAFVRERLRAESPLKGLGHWQHAGVAQLLWAPQATMAFDALPPTVVGEIQEQFGVAMRQSTAAWEERLEAAYAVHFTETGRARSGKQAPRHAQLARRLNELEARREELAAAWRDFHEASGAIERSRKALEETERQTVEAESHLRAARESCARSSELRRRQAECKGALSAARQAYQAEHERSQSLARLESERASASQLVDRAAELEEKLKPELVAAGERLAAAESELASRRTASQEAEAAAARAAAGERLAKLTAEARALDDRLARLAEAEAEASSAMADANANPAPAADDIARLRRALEQRDRAAARLEATSLRITITPRADGQLDVIGGESSAETRLVAGQPHELRAEGELELEWRGVGRIRVSAPNETAAAARLAVEESGRELQALAETLGTIDLEAIHQRQERARECALRLRRATERRELALESHSRDHWQRLRSELESEREKILESEPAWRQASPAHEACKEAAETALAARRALDEAQNARDGAQRQFHELQRRAQAADAERRRAAEMLERITTELARTAASGPAADEARLRELAMAVHLAQAQLAEIERQREGLPDDPEAVALQREQALRALQGRREQSLREIAAAETRLGLRIEQSPYGELAAVEEEIADLQTEIEAGRREAQAVRLLHNTYHECRREFGQQVSTMIEEAARGHFERIFGRSAGAVRINEGLAAESIEPASEAAETGVSLDRLSGGEQEQVHFAVRLALAESLAADERQVFVLDDALPATDPQRLQRVLRILEEAADRLQIVILTCDPERYRSLQGAKWFDLATARRSGSQSVVAPDTSPAVRAAPAPRARPVRKSPVSSQGLLPLEDSL